MIRLLLSSFFFVGIAVAATPFERLVASEIRMSAGLPDAANVSISKMTPVRGSVDDVVITQFDRRSGRFEATIGYRGTEAPISGRANVTVPVVVASSTLRRDHTITDGDIEIRDVALNQAPSTAYTMRADVLGKAVRRSLVAGRPIREDDVGAPIVLKKNGSIDIVYRTPGISLSTRGRALEEGAIGDSIRVMSEGQDRIVVGEVVSPGRVVVN